MLLTGNHLCEAVVIGARLWVLCGSHLWVVIDDHNTYSDGTKRDPNIYILWSSDMGFSMADVNTGQLRAHRNITISRFFLYCIKYNFIITVETIAELKLTFIK